jgi:inosine-uridine nucleoside N-ribohydrolase
MLRLAIALLLASSLAWSQPARRKVIIDQDCSGPGGSNLQTVALLINSPQVEVLGITVVSGNQWRDEEVAHVLRLLEIMGRTDIPVFYGAAFPLIRTRDEAQAWQDRYGKISFAGAWDNRWWHEPFVVPALPEGNPATKAAAEDAVHFLIRMTRQYPGEVTIYEGGPMTNLALAISLEPRFPELARELVFMGASLNPRTAYEEFANNPRHEFNFWFDPEAAFIALRAPWKKVTCTPVDISIKTLLTKQMVDRIKASGTPLANYIARFFHPGGGNDYMWDELAALAWIDPSMITKRETRYMSVDIEHGAGYGNTVTWDEQDKPKAGVRPVEVQVDLDQEKFYAEFINLARKGPVAALN